MEKNKFVLPLIIILLLVFLPCSAYGIYEHALDLKAAGNPEHLHRFEGSLYYYDANGGLIGKYKCINTDCNDAVTTIDDEYLKHYKGDTFALGVIANSYVFIQDGNLINLYNLKTNIVIASFSSIKNYGATIAGNYLIVKNVDNLYGVLSLDNIVYIVNSEYQFIGLKNSYTGSGIDSNYFVVMNDNSWYLIDQNTIQITANLTYPIEDYDQTHLFTIDDDKYYIYDYDGNQMISTESIIKYEITDKYYIISTEDGKILIYDQTFEHQLKEFTSAEAKLDYKIEDNIIYIYDGNTLLEKYDLMGVI